MADPLPEVRARLRAHPEEAAWWNWLVFERETARAVGSVAFAGPPNDAGAVLIGYAMYEQFEGHGYATEAVRALIGWAFQQPGVKQVRTLAPVWNTPAVRVAENVGMRPVASDEDDDVGEVLVYAVRGTLRQHPSDRPDQERQDHSRGQRRAGHQREQRGERHRLVDARCHARQIAPHRPAP